MTLPQLQEALQQVQQTLDTISDQELTLTLSISIKPKYHSRSWMALAEAHLRERVSNPHDFRSLSIEIEGMRNVGIQWEDEFEHNLSLLVRFLNKLYNTNLRSTSLWNSLETISDKHLYRIQKSSEYWRNFL